MIGYARTSKRNVQQKYYIIRQIYRLCSICTCSYSKQNATCQYANFTFYLWIIIATFFSNVSSGYTRQKAFVPKGILFDKANLRSNLQHPFKQCYYYIIHAHFSSQFVIHSHNNDFSHREKKRVVMVTTRVHGSNIAMCIQRDQ